MNLFKHLLLPESIAAVITTEELENYQLSLEHRTLDLKVLCPKCGCDHTYMFNIDEYSTDVLDLVTGIDCQECGKTFPANDYFNRQSKDIERAKEVLLTMKQVEDKIRGCKNITDFFANGGN